MSKETLTLKKPRIPEAEYSAAQRVINHQLIEDMAKKGLQDIGVTIDFDESIQDATRQRLADVMHYLQVIRRKNKAIREHNS
jgi:sulfatase maturation enzyme AslB (radical SAM superfamily)